MRSLNKAKIKINEADFQLKFGSVADYDDIISDNCIVRDASTGLIVAGLFKGAISPQTAKRSYPAFMQGFRYKTDNRGAYSGSERVPDGPKKSRAELVHSYTGGYFERQGGYTPICRATSFTRENAKAWKQQVQFLTEMADIIKTHDPYRS